MFLRCLQENTPTLLVMSVLFLTGFLTPFSLIPNRKTYTVSQTPSGVKFMSWPLRRQQLRQLNTFSVQGHLEVQAHDNKSVNLTFRWEQCLDLYRLKFLDVKGRVLMEMVEDKTTAKLYIKNKAYIGSDAELLMQKHLGVPIPLSYFTDWLRGIPSLGVRHERVLNPTKHLLTLNQGGWFIRYLRYHKIRAVDLPTQLCMMRKDFYVRVLVSHWKL